MSVGRICQREVDLAEPDEKIRAAAQRMGTRCVGSLIVVDAKRRPIGILTDRDVALRVVADDRDPERVTVADAMTREPATISERAPIEDALALMRSHGVRRLPVVAPSGELCGVVSLDDILALLADEFRQVGRLIEKSSPRSLAQR